MKICLLSRYGQSSNLLYEGTRKGLEDLGIEYLDINVCQELKQAPPHWISIPTLKPELINPELETKLIKKIQDFAPDHLLLLQYTGLPFLINNGPELRKIIKGEIALWLVDNEEVINQNSQLSQYLDTLLLSNAGQLSEYQQKWSLKKAIFMPQAALYLSKPNSKLEQKFNIGFLGRRQREDKRYDERNALLDAFANKLGMQEPQEVLNSDEIIKFYQQCKIVIGTSWKNDVYLYSSDRIFNILGAGGFYLLQYFPGIEKLFENHRHLVWFKNTTEGLNLANKYLDDPRARFRISQQGYELVSSKHTYKHRLNNIIKILNDQMSNFDGFYNS